MRRILIACLLLFVAGAASAGPYADDLAKCMVGSTSKSDRELLVRWMFAAAAANPAVAPIANVPAGFMDQANAQMGALIMRLLTDTCKDKTRDAIIYEGPGVVQTSFQVLGQAAAGEMFASPEVRRSMAGLGKYVDEKKIGTLRDP